MIIKILKVLLPESLRIKIRKSLAASAGITNDLNAKYVYPQDWLKKNIYYGQYGEDAKLLTLFKNQKNGYFIEVGAMEGIRFSNTYIFELMGWKGICVEPHPDYIELLKKNRPNSVIIQAAASDSDKEAVDFYTNFRGSLSTLDKSLEGNFKKHYGKFFGGFKAIKVPQASLNSILKKHNVGEPIDILSLDTEGTEEDVLKGFDLEKYSPRIVIVEISIRKDNVEKYLAERGYILACENPSNAIFCRSKSDVDFICRTAVVGAQVFVPHPLD